MVRSHGGPWERDLVQFAIIVADMINTIPTLNHWSDAWLGTAMAVLWQSALLVALAALIAWLLRRSSPVVRYWLWQIVAVKLLLMPFWTLAIPLPTWWESNQPEKASAIRPSEYPAGELDRTVIKKPFPTAQGAETKTAPTTPPVWDKLKELSWRAWLLIVWILVVIMQIGRLLLQHFRLKKLLRRAKPIGGEIATIVADLARQIGLRRLPAIVSVAGECPLFVCGLRQPTLVLPSRLLDTLRPDERRQVILHELAHIKRRDLLWGWPVEIARIVYFFNPFVYWVGYQIRLERELACDQLAMACSGNSAADYAQTLVQVVSHASEPAAIQAAAIAAGLTGSEKRMKDEG
jgi:bla regulator protein blaR1